MRTAFIDQLIEEAKGNDKIFLLVADLGFSVIEPFAEQFPDRYLNVGIAEQNMAGIAAGLAMEGYCVYIYSIGNFPTLRCMEQIRYDICYHNLNVNIVAVGGGYAYGALGPSHHATEELGMLRAIPNLVVCAPADPLEAKAITEFTATYAGPCYIRLGKAGEPIVHQANNNTLIIGKGQILDVRTEGNGTAIFSTGSMLKYAADFVDANKLSASIYSFPFIKPIDKTYLLQLFKKYTHIITIEEHQASCGFGSAILELLNDLTDEGLIEKQATPHIKRIAIRDKFYSIAGSQEYLRKEAGLELKTDFFK
jgi:transketolase